MLLPKAPYFTWNPKDGGFDLTARGKAPTKSHANRLGLLSAPDTTTSVFDSAGGVWNFRFQGPLPKPSLFNKVLAQVYNPRCEVELTWTRVRDYEVEELVQAYSKAIAMDDDILTQFVDGGDIEERLKPCKTFEDVVKVWEWANTEQEGDQDDDVD